MPQSPAQMADDDLCSELMETVLMAKSGKAWDRERLREVCAQVADRRLLRGPRPSAPTASDRSPESS